MISRRRLVSLFGTLGLGAIGVAFVRSQLVWPAPETTYAEGRTSTGWLPFRRRTREPVLVAIRVNGEPMEALLDSGAQYTVIDRSLAERLGLKADILLPLFAYGVSGAPQRGSAARVTVDIGPLRLERVRAAVLDLGPVGVLAGRPFAFVIGRDILRAAVLDLDLPRSRLAFHAPGFRPPAEALRIPTQMRDGAFHAPVTVEGRPRVDALVDTGATAALALSNEAAEAAGLLGGRAVRTVPSISLGGVASQRLVTASHLSLAGFDFERVPVQVYASGLSALLPDGLIGLDLLERFRVIMDHAGGALFFAPDEKRLPLPFPGWR